MGKAELVDECVDRVGRGCCGGGVAVAEVFGVAVELLLAFLGGEAGLFAAADDAAVALADASAETAEDFAVLISPAPETMAMVR